MKTTPVLLFFAVLLIGVYACKKDSSTSIIGKWSIVKTEYHYAKDTTVNGTATDYYNFASNGNLSIQDHQDSYTGIFSSSGANSVGITIYTVDGHGMGVSTSPAIFTITRLSNGNITLTSPPYPSGQEVVYLKK